MLKKKKVEISMESLSNSDHHSSMEDLEMDMDIIDKADMKVIYLLKKNYYKTIYETLKLCMSHDKYLN